jgi:serine/threonine-protein kinase RsbW
MTPGAKAGRAGRTSEAREDRADAGNHGSARGVSSPVVFPAVAVSLARVRDLIARACREHAVPEEACFALTLAADEVCSNVIEHGYAGMAAGTIEVGIEVSAGEMRVIVTDHGRLFLPGQAPEPDLTLDWQDRPVGGLGWHLVRSLVDALDHRPNPGGGNIVALVKRFGRGSAGPEEGSGGSGDGSES